MHIPDGYLSPSTCATLYVAACGAWSVALKRVKRSFSARAIPLISVFAAFCFVLMMFNLPLPGGTTGHATGIAIASIILGPSGSILAASIAITIQAFLFGDGGITTLGANCFNMAVIGSMSSYVTYKLFSGRQSSDRRKIWAAAVAGYISSNLSALITAVELGIQPMLFHDSNGSPLYAPYPLRIAVPAMMLGHLLLVGTAEAFITGGMFSYLLKANPEVLPDRGNSTCANSERHRIRFRPLWVSIAVLMVLTPLGILASGTGWGEWTISELQRHIALPAGMSQLSELWRAPIPDYAPTFIRSKPIGYLLSAVCGAGMLFLLYLVLAGKSAGRSATEQ